MVDTLELVARREVLALGCDAAEVVRVVLEAAVNNERCTAWERETTLTNDASGWCTGSELRGYNEHTAK